MKVINYQIKDSIGLTSKNCAELVAEANCYENCSIELIHTETKEGADLKSIMNVMGLIIKSGEHISININGEPNEEELAYKQFIELLKNLAL